MTVENGKVSERGDNQGSVEEKDNDQTSGEVTLSKCSENKVTGPSDNVQKSGKDEAKQPSAKNQKPVKDIRVVNLTKKIFASFPIKHEIPDPADNASSKPEVPLESESETEVMLYISDDGTVHHAIQIEKQHEDIDKQSLYTEKGVAYFIRPIKDDELCDLVIEYLELIKETPKGIFCIDIGGNLLKEVNKKCSSKVTGSEKEAAVKNTESETANQFEFQDDQPGELYNLRVRPKTVLTPQQSRKQELLKLYEQGEARNFHGTKKPKSILKGKGFGAKKNPVAVKKTVDDALNYPKNTYRKRRRNERLLVDKKTDIPIQELKMNMQITHDIVSQGMEPAVAKKKVKTFDTLMQSPGKNIQSEKLLEIYSSRLVTNTAEDSDADQDLELPELNQESRRFTGWYHEDPAAQYSGLHKICYL